MDKMFLNLEGKIINKNEIETIEIGEFISEYPSATEAARYVGGRIDAIAATARGFQKTSAGFIWKYKDWSYYRKIEVVMNVTDDFREKMIAKFKAEREAKQYYLDNRFEQEYEEAVVIINSGIGLSDTDDNVIDGHGNIIIHTKEFCNAVWEKGVLIEDDYPYEFYAGTKVYKDLKIDLYVGQGGIFYIDKFDPTIYFGEGLWAVKLSV